MSLGSQQSGSTTSTQQNDPWWGAQPYMHNLFGKAQYQASQGQAHATQQAQQLQQQRALSGSPLVDAAQDQNLATIRGDYTNLSSNPAAQDAMNMAKTKINSQFGGDNFGNSAHQEWLGRGLLSAASPFYESERNRQQQATAMAPSLANQDYTDISQLNAVGQQQEKFPWQQLQNMQGILSSAQGSGTSTNSQPYYTNPLGELASTGLTAAMAYSMFSDRRLKRDIQKVGNHPVGVPLYTYKYLWSDEPQIGVMADELEEVLPEAVIDGPYKMVNYGMFQ